MPENLRTFYRNGIQSQFVARAQSTCMPSFCLLEGFMRWKKKETHKRPYKCHTNPIQSHSHVSEYQVFPTRPKPHKSHKNSVQIPYGIYGIWSLCSSSFPGPSCPKQTGKVTLRKAVMSSVQSGLGSFRLIPKKFFRRFRQAFFCRSSTINAIARDLVDESICRTPLQIYLSYELSVTW